MTAEPTFERYLGSLLGSWRALTAPQPSARVLTGDGWFASIDPPDPIFTNGVLLDPTAFTSVVGALPAGSPTAIWTADDAGARPLVAAGWRPDEVTRAMLAVLDGAELADPARDATRVDGSVVAVANGLRPGLLDNVPGLRAYASAHGACVAALIEVGDDVNVGFVHTRPGLRRRGLAGSLLAAALTEARADGYVTASLQGTAVACGVYRRLGFVDVGIWQEWQPPV